MILTHIHNIGFLEYISNYLLHLELRNRSIQIVVITKSVVISNVSIKRFDCNSSYSYLDLCLTSVYILYYLLQVFQGLLRADKDFHDTRHAMTRLWIHECFRVFSDRLIDDNDRENFIYLMTEKLGTLFDQTYHNICPNKQPPIFGKV